MPEDPRDRMTGAPRVLERVGAIEGVALLLLVAVGLVVFGLASHTTWPVVVGGILLVLTVLDAVVLSWVRRRR
jgi:membrane protein YdbS with pleckstrin-like domain